MLNLYKFIKENIDEKYLFSKTNSAESSDLVDTVNIHIFMDFRNLIKSYINSHKELLNDDYIKVPEENIWIHKTASVSPDAKLIPGPAGAIIIEEGARICGNCLIRDSVIIGRNCVIGNNIEITRSILNEHVVLAHFNYIGDSILGKNVHFAGGAITANSRLDRDVITYKDKNKKYDLLTLHFGSVIGDDTEIGCNVVLNPATFIGKNSSIYPLVNPRAQYIPANSIVKTNKKIVRKK